MTSTQILYLSRRTVYPIFTLSACIRIHQITDPRKYTGERKNTTVYKTGYSHCTTERPKSEIGHTLHDPVQRIQQ